MGVGLTGDKRKEISIPGLAQNEEVLRLAKPRALAFHHPLPGHREKRERQKCRGSPRVEHSLEMSVWDAVLCSGLHTSRGTDFVDLNCILQIVSRMERTLKRRVTGEVTKGTENVYPEKRRLV